MSPTTSSIPFVLFPAVGTLAIYVALALVRRSRSTPFPPGPRPDPLIGNVRQMGSNDLHVLAEQWAKKYGEHHSDEWPQP